jgi:RluA family pseudouridine synthase
MSEETVLSSRISSNYSGLTLIDFLCRRFKYHTRAEWSSLIIRGKITVNDASVSQDFVLNNKDTVTYAVILREPPVDANIQIAHCEAAFLVAFKPGNLPSHADGNFIKNTFIYILRKRLTDHGYRGPVKLVHRLDRETSGLIVVAKTKEAHRILVKQFENGSVEKEYMAVARGVIEQPNFEVGGAIVSDTDSRISIRKKVVPAASPGAKPAFTRFEVVERLADFTLVRCMPATGRTNQIRIHLAHCGHPLAGDKLYGRSDEEFLEFVRRARAGNLDPLPWMEASRHLLHAAKISFIHPVTGVRVGFECAMPEDMLEFIECHK